MARLRLLSRAARSEAAPDAAPPAPARRALPPPGRLRRERRALLRVREDRLRDLGGLMLEMYRRDQFREDLLLERCVELTALDDRLQELDALLAAATIARRPRSPARCQCGHPIAWGAHFCPECGRPFPGASPATTCSVCGSALPAGAQYCASCGRPVDPTEAVGPGLGGDGWGDA